MHLLAMATTDQSWLSSEMKACRCTDGFERRVFSTGSGPVLVCVPVLDRFNFLYAPQIRLLQDRRRVVTYAPILSTSAAVSLDNRVTELCAVLDTIQADSVDVLGWSDGGAIACNFAARYPSRTRSLTVLSLPRRFNSVLRAGARLVPFLPLQTRFSAVFIRWMLAMLSRGPAIKFDSIIAQLREIPDLVQLLRYSLLPLLQAHVVDPHTISCPSLVLVGDRDRFVSVKAAGKLAQVLPNAQELIVIEKGEHFLTYANAVAVNRYIDLFLPRKI
jgi:pimeloyl-ACP methyl ester carboxylesterase